MKRENNILCLCGKPFKANALIRNIVLRGVLIPCPDCLQVPLSEWIVSQMGSGQIGITFARWNEVYQFPRQFPNMNEIRQINGIYSISGWVAKIRMPGEPYYGPYCCPQIYDLRRCKKHDLYVPPYIKYSELMAIIKMELKVEV